jgi:hypothetical protein
VMVVIVVVVRHGCKVARLKQKVKRGQVTDRLSPAMLGALGGTQPWPRRT